MLLRRIIGHMETQNWTAVALDFAIVVFGVFFGLQVSSWNNARADREIEQYYVERLTEDVRSSMAFNAYMDDVLARRIGEALAVRDGLDTCGPLEPGLFGNVAYNLGKNAAPRLSRGVYTEMVSTGRQGLIRSDAVREALADAYEYVELQAKLFDLMGLDELPSRQMMSRRVVLRVDAPFPYDTRHPEEAFRYDYEALCRDEEFKNAFDLLMTASFEADARYDRVHERLQALLDSLTEYGETLKR
ncbi:MAG: hypothetical protein AAF830_03575 [Pseudomonadota bacterium]